MKGKGGLVLERLQRRLSHNNSNGNVAMQKLEKIIISCLTQIVASAEFKRLERTDDTARLICAAARQVVQQQNLRRSEPSANEGEV